LGWNIKNIDEVREQRRTLTGLVDYPLNVNGQPKIFVEIKKLSESLDMVRTIRGREESYPEQAIRYAWHMKADWVVLSNFAETRLYYSHVIKSCYI
jgi:predicted type IV restriction endonuclease